jgi:hypothetical protein
LFIRRLIFPNFIAVDFVEKGDYGGAKEIVSGLNYKKHSYPTPILITSKEPAQLTSGSFSLHDLVNWDSLAIPGQMIHLTYCYINWAKLPHNIGGFFGITFPILTTSSYYVFSNYIPHEADIVIVSFSTSIVSIVAHKYLKKPSNVIRLRPVQN